MKPYHIGIDKDDIKGASIALLTGDPGRVKTIASFLSEPKRLAVSREYTSYLGKINDKYVLVISTGMNKPNFLICNHFLRHFYQKYH